MTHLSIVVEKNTLWKLSTSSTSFPTVKAVTPKGVTAL